MPAGRVLGVYKRRLSASVSSTVVGDGTTRVIPVDSNVVDFDEEGGQFVHAATGDVYTYDSADFDQETITLSSGLPVGKTLSVDSALNVINPDGRRAFDYYADIAVDDVDSDVVAASVPEDLQGSLLEGARQQGQGPLVIADAEGEEWQVQKLVGEEAPGGLVPGDLKATVRDVTGGGVLQDGGWLKCDGAAVSRSVYAALFNAIGTAFGAGNGTTTFNLPDLRGRTIFGTGSLVTLGQDEGKAETNRGPGHTHAVINHGGHAHNIANANHSGTPNASGFSTSGGSINVVQNISGTANGQHDHSGSTGSGGDHDHSGATGNSVASNDPMGYMGIHYLVKV